MTSALEPLKKAELSRAPSHRRETARRLRNLRERHRRSVTADLDVPAAIALCILVRPEQDPAERLAVAHDAAARHGYTVVEVLVEDAWQTHPGLRPRLARAHALLRQELVHGLVAASRVDISCDDTLYESQLQRLHSAGGFLHLAHDETRF